MRRGGEQSDNLGPDRIAEAVYSNQPVTDNRSAIMGEPRLQDFAPGVFTDYKIVIPLGVDTEVDMAPFVFDVPDDPELSGRLGELAGFYNVEAVDNIGDLEGGVVPVEWPDGYPRPAMNVLRDESGDGE